MNFTDKEPIYKQISDYFCKQILEKSGSPMTVFPPFVK